jgi:TrmH family RNA methyltransferase
MVIESKDNPRIRRIRGLLDARQRRASGLCLVEGVRNVAAALQAQATLECLVVDPRALQDAGVRAVLDAPGARRVERLEVTAAVFRTLSRQENPHGLAAVVQQRWLPLDQARLAPDQFWLALDTVRDPGNLGTLVRTAEAVGVGGILLLGHSTDPYHPLALRASAGTLFFQHLVKTTFEAFRDWKVRHGYPVIGSASQAAEDYRACTYHTPLILLLGSEGAGLAAAQRQVCDRLVAIPMAPHVESLNLAVAAGVLLYEIFTQTRSGAASRRVAAQE